MAIMGYNLDPLVFVLPFLISLMAFRHSHQLYNRYYEEYIKTRDAMAGVRVIIEQMFLPGLTSIITDAFGVAIVAITPVPVLQHIAIAGAFWSIITVIVGLILTPVLLTYVPVSPKLLKHIEHLQLQDEQRKGWENKFADWLAPWLVGKGRYIVIVVSVLITVLFLLLVGEADCRRCRGGVKPPLSLFPLQPGQRAHQPEFAAHKPALYHAGGRKTALPHAAAVPG